MESGALEQDIGGRTDGGAKRRQIMDGAREVFLVSGFDGASMNDVARAAGVSKGTLYAYFNSKDELFEAIIRAEYEQAAERLCAFPPDCGDMRTMLADFAARLLNRMTDPTTVALVRVVIAAVEKFPKVGRAFFESGPMYGNMRLAGHLRAFERAGLLRLPDPERAAWQFVELCASPLHKRLLFGMVESVSREEIEAAVEAGVDVFLKAYGV